MKARFLFAAHWRMIGYVLILASLLFFVFDLKASTNRFIWPEFHSKIEGASGALSNDESFDDEIQLAGIVLGLLLVAFSKERVEDEHIGQLRLDSLQWAVYVNYAIFIVIIFCSYGLNFLFYTMYNILTLLVFFIIRFRWMIYKNNKLISKETSLA
ncbi:hypothetical protein GCM10027037_26040 [Mucilaginibacter koreensis]